MSSHIKPVCVWLVYATGSFHFGLPFLCPISCALQLLKGKKDKLYLFLVNFEAYKHHCFKIVFYLGSVCWLFHNGHRYVIVFCF